jgi:hypothetical protein
VNRSVLARTEDTPARRNSSVGAVSQVGVNHSDAWTCAQNPSISGEIGIDSSPKIVNAHVHHSHTPTELRGHAGMSREINKCCDNASVIVALVWRTAELVTMTNIQRGNFGNSDETAVAPTAPLPMSPRRRGRSLSGNKLQSPVRVSKGMVWLKPTE